MENQRCRSRFNHVCVFCGSSPGKKPGYQLATTVLGKELVERNIYLIYERGSVGLMRLVSQVVYDGDRHVLGVIPNTLMPRDITRETVGEVRAVSSMHQRKAKMARQADAFIALPDREANDTKRCLRIWSSTSCATVWEKSSKLLSQGPHDQNLVLQVQFNILS
ncbi:hypothetical protein Syun_011960 [Stephania yunnanensis]|uniref:cytokinin riboside 5'-monophosphate phosphoribohydrolase n=1 Tax=Stephania yunnanensis TaxID=152371 RepID=A0AAP0K0T3_9MAGN